MKKNFVKFIAQIAIVSLLFTVGCIVICGEPSEDANFIATIIAQLAISIFCYSSAICLGRKWQINRKMTFTGLFQ